MSPPAAEPRRLRVLQLCAVEFTARHFVLPLAGYLRHEGFDVRVGFRKGPDWAALEKLGTPLVALPMSRSANPFSTAYAALRLASYLRRRPCDVLHVHTPAAALAGRIAAVLARVPVVVYTVHGFYFHDGAPPFAAALHRGLERLLRFRTDYLLCVSEEDAQTAEQLRLCPAPQIFAVRNGVDAGRFDPVRHRRTRPEMRGKLGIPEDAKVVAFVGRLTREKGVLDLVRAAEMLRRSVPGVRILLVGDCLDTDRDDAKPELEKTIRDCGLEDCCIRTGMREDVPALLAAADAFCLPSYREGLPVSVLEAMMMGLPVVATRIRGCREAVVDGQTGFLVQPASPVEIASALGYLLTHDDVASKMGGAGRRRAEEFYDIHNAMAAVGAVYRRIEEDLPR